MTDEHLTDGQQLAVHQLREIARRTEDFEVVSVEPPSEEGKKLRAFVSLCTAPLEQSQEGLPLRTRERFRVHVPPDFPFERPRVWVRHDRFAMHSHVQWKRYLCLYLAPDVEWNPSDGIYGFMDRFWEWLRRGALDELDPTGAPLHPPVAYRSPDAPLVVPRANTPTVGDEPWQGFVRLSGSERRTDVIEWEPFQEASEEHQIGAAILLSEPMPFEFPRTVAGLASELQDRGVSRAALVHLLMRAALKGDAGNPLFLLLGTPMRGVRGSDDLKQHLTAWRMNEDVAGVLRVSNAISSDDEDLSEIGGEALDSFLGWANKAKVQWCKVREARSEIVTRRDHNTPLSAFAGKTVAVWGCGALGARVALSLARAGAEKLILRDNGTVTPGVLVRQPYDDADVGRPKTEALRQKLRRVRPELDVDARPSNVLKSVLSGDSSWTDDADVVIDCTASRIVRSKLEHVRQESGREAVPAVSMFISADATRGMVAVAGEKYSGGPADVFRKASIRAFSEPSLRPFADAFHPEREDEDLFQPEPGCSSPTFVGSAADASALAGTMLNCAATSLLENSGHEARSPQGDIAIHEGETEAFSFDAPPSAWAHFVTQPHAAGDETRSQARFSWQPDLVSPDPRRHYEVRVTSSAWQAMRSAIGRSKRKRGPKVETGGLLFGRRDDASKVIWVDEATGPPPDSTHRADLFVCGTDGTQAENQKRKARTRGAVQYVGMWHTHPASSPTPSGKDLEGMRKMIGGANLAPSRALLTIVGTPHSHPTVGTHVFDRSDVGSFAGVARSRASMRPSSGAQKPRRESDRDVGLALSGGGSRAIAFHLGCLRALHDMGLLARTNVVSAVSGGAVIAALYAYSEGSFSRFEERVLRLLREGLQAGIARRTLLSKRALQAAGTSFTAGALARGTRFLQGGLSWGYGLIGGGSRARRPEWLDALQPPLPRWRSRLTAFEDVLRSKLFGEMTLASPTRDHIDVVLNAAELRTGTAFRFGSKCSAGWRHGYIDGNGTEVATAVAASAAYPALLPAMHRTFPFVKRDGQVTEESVVLTDGGVFENLGASCLEPGRDERYSYHVYDCDHLVCCSAGHGRWDGKKRPYGWKSRMQRSFGIALKKRQDGMKRRLFSHRYNGPLESFVFPYLGQRREKLTRGLEDQAALPEDFVRRDQVVGYPTDFQAMPPVDIKRLTRRGEQLTRLLTDAYGPSPR